ncbi:DNA-binding protein [Candidatus Woesearchaeota archaeon]|nr:DNA-binding protein [Candidatus Woesearchaeota archaeon]
MKVHVLRLHPKQDLKEELVKFTKENNILAGFILTCVGSLMKATLRMADEDETKNFEENMEIVSLVGTLSQDGVHLHISLSNKEGNTIGGHLKEGCLIYTTAEIVIGELEELIFSREFDKQTWFKELMVSKK